MSQTEHKGDHGTMNSYIVGFILSLAFTFIPYFLVVNKYMQGNGLLATILGFAFIQMLVQIFFFLHLGRGPKPLYNVAFFVGTVGTIAVVVVGSIFIMKHLNYNMAPTDVSKYIAQDENLAQVNGALTGACQGRGASHTVTISGGVVSPAHTEAKLCDTITFINEDDKVRDIAFGPHPKHDGYAGETELLVRKGRGKSINLNELGSYLFHDHLEETVSGTFTVTK